MAHENQCVKKGKPSRMEYCDYEGDEEESHYNTPLLKRRATATAGYTQTTHSLPTPVQQPVKRSPSLVTSFGIGMCLVVLLLMFWYMVIAPWIHALQLRWEYGTRQVSV